MSNIQPFPLYDRLYQQASAQTENSFDIRKITATINVLENQEHIRIIYALILHHELKQMDGNRWKSIPYNGTIFKEGRGVTFNITNIPPILQRVIVEYILIISNN